VSEELKILRCAQNDGGCAQNDGGCAQNDEWWFRPGGMPTDVFGPGHVIFSKQHAHASVGMAPVEKEMSLIDEIREKLARGERLGLADGMALYEEGDLSALGKLAEEVTLQRTGRKVYYSINRHINYTNVCRFRCGFCGFSRDAGDEGAYAMSPYEVVEQAEEAWREGATEVHIVGGVSKELVFDYYLEMLDRIRGTCPDLHIKAFTAVEILDLAEKAGKSVEETLERLMDFGLDSLPGGGAEILSDEYFEQACPQKPKPEQWLEVHRTAHRLGLMSNATMLYGYVESIEDRVRHLLRLRELQDESLEKGEGKFQCFVPLPYINPKSEIRNPKQIQMTEIQNKKTEEAPLPAEAGKGATPSEGANMPKLRVGMPPTERTEDSEILRCAQNDNGTGGARPHPTNSAQPRPPRHADSREIDVVDDLKTVAISRLLLDNIEHIKAFWPMLGAETAQIALCYGADDLDGTVREYRIVERESHAHDKRGHGTEHLSVEQIRGMIEETGREAVQRDGYYKILNSNL
jgi:aminodeoxyfutalosine synthase